MSYSLARMYARGRQTVNRINAANAEKAKAERATQNMAMATLMARPLIDRVKCAAGLIFTVSAESKDPEIVKRATALMDGLDDFRDFLEKKA